MLPARRLGRGSLAPWPSALSMRWCTPPRQCRHASSLQRALAGTNYLTPNESQGTSSLMEALTLPPKEEETVVPSEDYTVRTPPSALLKALDSRGLINQMVGTRGHFSKLTADPEKVKCGAYAGIDPTAPSLHVGHLLPMMALYWMGWHGLDTVALVGDATAAIGDPTGRTTTRPVLSPDELKHNTKRLTTKLQALSTNARELLRQHCGEEPSRQSRHAVLTNSKWLHEMPLIVSLQMFGNAFRIGTMLSRDTAKTKVASKEGMSLSEFMYPVLQAHDWFHLRKTRRVHIQIGGSDQYGNILSGSNAVWSAFQSRLHSYDEPERDIIHTGPAGITVPLLTTSSGAKFGKSAGNAIWLDATMTDPFDFYTYFVGVTDDDVGPMLKIFTFLPIEQIDAVMQEHELDPSRRRPQHALAKEVTSLAHGAAVAKRMSLLHSLMFQPISRAALHDFVAALPEVKSDKKKDGSLIESREGVVVTIKKSTLEGLPPTKFLQALEFETVKSATAASRLIAARGAYIGTLPSGDAQGEDMVAFQRFQEAGIDTKADWGKFLVEGVLLVRSGKKGFRIVRVI